MKSLLFLLCALAASAPFLPESPRAQPLERLALAEALAKAEANALVRDEFGEASGFFAEREREKWRKLYLPSVTLERTQRSGGLTGQEREGTTEVRVNYLLYGGGRDRAGYRVARHATASNRLNQEDVLAELKLMTAEVFLHLASSLRRVQSLEIAVTEGERETDRAERRAQLGLRAKLDVLQSRVALADRRLELDAELQRRRELAQQLTHLLREEVTTGTRIEVAQGIGAEPRPLAYYRQWAERHHPAILKAAAERNKALEEAALEKAARYPELSLTAGVSDSEGENESRSLALSLVYRFGGHRAVIEQSSAQSTFEQRFFRTDSSGEIVEASVVQERNVNTTRYGVTFYDFQDATASAESALFQARLNLARAERLAVEAREESVREIGQRLGDLNAALRRYEVENLRVDKNAAELRAYRRAFQAGTVRFEELLEKQTADSRGRLDRINALVEVRLARVNLRNAAGLPLVEP